MKGENMSIAKKWQLWDFFFLGGHGACGILSSQPGIKSEILALEGQSNHWTGREVPKEGFLISSPLSLYPQVTVTLPGSILYQGVCQSSD